MSRTEQGQASVEFALSIIAVLLTMFLSWELLMSMYTASVLADAAKEGVRYAIVRGTNSTDCGVPPTDCNPPTTSAACTASTASTAVTHNINCYAQASLHDISAITITVNYPNALGGGTPPPGTPGTNDVGNQVVVTITYNYLPYINVPFAPTFTTHASGRIVN